MKPLLILFVGLIFGIVLVIAAVFLILYPTKPDWIKRQLEIRYVLLENGGYCVISPRQQLERKWGDELNICSYYYQAPGSSRIEFITKESFNDDEYTNIDYSLVFFYYDDCVVFNRQSSSQRYNTAVRIRANKWVRIYNVKEIIESDINFKNSIMDLPMNKVQSVVCTEFNAETRQFSHNVSLVDPNPTSTSQLIIKVRCQLSCDGSYEFIERTEPVRTRIEVIPSSL